MTGSTEVQLTSRRSARWQKAVVGVALGGTIIGAAIAIATDPQWWAILIWVVVSLILAFLLVGLWVSATENARATESLLASGIDTRADVIAGERVTLDDEIRYVLTLRIRPVGHDEFTVTHSCSDGRCKTASESVPTTITALVDARTRTWAIRHG